MSDKRNLLLAVVLTIAILFGWPYISNHFFPVANQPAPVVAGAPAGSAAPVEKAPEAIRETAVVLKESPRLAIETPKLKGSINLKGARIDDIVLPQQKETIAKDSPPVRLFSPSGTKDAYFASFSWIGQGATLPDANSLWTADGATLTPDTPVRLHWDNGAGQRFVIALSIDKDYMLTVAQTVENRSANSIVVQPYGLLSHLGVARTPSTWTIHTGPVGVFNDKANYSVDFKDLDKEGAQRFQTTGGWLGFTDLYWHAALIPAQSSPIEAQFRAGADKRYQADITYAPVTLAPGKSATTASRLFVGAKETRVLEAYTDNAGVMLFDRAIDWGWFYFLTKPIFKLLDTFYQWFGNFGVAIMALTVLIKLIFFPLANKSYAAMSRMKALQPEMLRIRQQYKDDKVRQQQEMMTLYKTEKVNPVAGCLPMLVQIPVFFALYKTLFVTIEMRHQPFFGWIHDLAAPDPTNLFTLFGLIPWDPPAMLHLGLWAIVMGITMFLQQKLNPAPQDPMQQRVFMLMPIFFTFLLASFPAGLVIYWTWNNTLSIAQQWLIMRRHQPTPKRA